MRDATTSAVLPKGVRAAALGFCPTFYEWGLDGTGRRRLEAPCRVLVGRARRLQRLATCYHSEREVIERHARGASDQRTLFVEPLVGEHAVNVDHVDVVYMQVRFGGGFPSYSLRLSSSLRDRAWRWSGCAAFARQFRREMEWLGVVRHRRVNGGRQARRFEGQKVTKKTARRVVQDR